MEREIYKGRGYRLHVGKMSGKVVTIKVYEGKRAREVSFTLTNHIHSDCFVEAVLRSSQIQPESYVSCRFIFNYDLELTIRSIGTQISLK